MAGGHVLHVRGRGFGSTADSVSVDIAGMPCHVLSATDSVVTCLTSQWEPSVSNHTAFVGGAGVNITQYTGVRVCTLCHIFFCCELGLVVFPAHLSTTSLELLHRSCCASRAAAKMFISCRIVRVPNTDPARSLLFSISYGSMYHKLLGFKRRGEVLVYP